MIIQYVIYAVIVLVVIFILSMIKILREYERGVIFTLGRFWKVKGPGLIIVIPIIQQMEKLSLRTVVMDVPPQDVISRDNVSVQVNAVVYFRVTDPQLAIIQVENYFEAISQLSQTTLRSVLGQHELDDMLAKRDRLNADIQKILDEQTDIWGVKVINVEIKHVDLNESMIRAIAQQAEAERARRAKVINAEGEFQAAQKLQEAAKVLSEQPASIQLRYLQSMVDISSDKSTTIVFPLPIDLARAFESIINKKKD
ncbi:MAG: slipin family protein [Francisellaceae bacterium]